MQIELKKTKQHVRMLEAKSEKEKQKSNEELITAKNHIAELQEKIKALQTKEEDYVKVCSWYVSKATCSAYRAKHR